MSKRSVDNKKELKPKFYPLSFLYPLKEWWKVPSFSFKLIVLISISLFAVLISINLSLLAQDYRINEYQENLSAEERDSWNYPVLTIEYNEENFQPVEEPIQLLTYNLQTGEVIDSSSEDITSILTEEANSTKVEGFIGNAPYIETEAIFGSDDRTKVGYSNMTVYPWRTIVKIKMRFGLSNYVCSGAMISTYHVLTAAHCIYDSEEGGWADSVSVAPGMYNSYKPYGESAGVLLHAANGWIEYESYQHDWGIIQISKPLGDQTGWMGRSIKNDSYFSGLNLKTTGYPGDLDDGEIMYHTTGSIDYVTETNIFHYADSAGGQSGSPLWSTESSEHYILGVHTAEQSSGGSPINNVGRRLDSYMEDYITSVINGDPLPDITEPQLTINDFSNGRRFDINSFDYVPLLYFTLEEALVGTGMDLTLTRKDGADFYNFSSFLICHDENQSEVCETTENIILAEDFNRDYIYFTNVTIPSYKSHFLVEGLIRNEAFANNGNLSNLSIVPASLIHSVKVDTYKLNYGFILLITLGLIFFGLSFIIKSPSKGKHYLQMIVSIILLTLLIFMLAMFSCDSNTGPDYPQKKFNIKLEKESLDYDNGTFYLPKEDIITDPIYLYDPM